MTDYACINYDMLGEIFTKIVDEYADANYQPIYISTSFDKPKNKYTKSQRGALHVWCEQCAKVLNDNGIDCTVMHPFTGKPMSMPWTMYSFKENVYKFILEAMTGKSSTENQSTVEPSDVAMVISKRYAENGLICPPWPSNR